ncbi:MAG: transglycosylase domain-containing protein [Candidatus Binataceae bacterium]|nr:transglycosylase domain-containing protein [Candidatus Binataceae bacterium]
MAKSGKRSAGAGKPPPGRRAAAAITGLLRRLGWRRGLVVGCVLCAFGAGFYLAQVYADISELIEERRAALTSAIYSAPLEISRGDAIAPLHLVERLDRLSYSRVTNVAHPGEYSMEPGTMSIFVREFTVGTHGQPPMLLRLSFAGDHVAAIADSFGAARPHAEIEPEVIGRLMPDTPAERVEVALPDVRPYLVSGLLDTEDRYFYYHFGFDPIRIVEAAIVDLHSHRLRQGASTLTQQLARTFIEQRSRSFHRKVRELAIALVLEMRLTKNEILERYINDVPMGSYDGTPIYGLPLAARYFFNKDLRAISPAEAATLIGMIQAPTLFDPRRHPDACRTRRDLVLGLMHKADAISDAEFTEAIATPVTTIKAPGLRRAPYFTDYVISQMRRIPGASGTLKGLKVYTTLDPELQELAQESLVSNLERIEKLHPSLRRRERHDLLESSLVSLDPHTGAIVAMVGGRDYAQSQFDRAADAERQPGSAFKPVVYLTAIDPELNPLPQPVTLASILPDRPMTFAGWTPANYERNFQGQVTVAAALAESLNVPTAYLGSLLSPARVIRTAHELGIHSELPDYLPVTIGAGEVTLLELTGVYQVFAAGGVLRPPFAIEAVVGGDGSLIYQYAPAPQRLTSRAVAYVMTGALRGVLQYGTAAGASRLGLDFVAAGKTGTTDDYRDAYFIGYTTQLVTGVWVGFDQPETIGLTGAAAALPAWVHFMVGAVRQPDLGFGPPPPGITMVAIDPASGGLATPGCPRVQNAPFLEGTEPTQPCPLHSGSFAGAPATVAASATGATPDTEAAGGAPGTSPPASPAPGTASNGVMGAVGSFFGALFGHATSHSAN